MAGLVAKLLALSLLTVQNCSQMLLMRHALVSNDYIAATAVVMQVATLAHPYATSSHANTYTPQCTLPSIAGMH